jgi:CheY-like chemotaxis protein
VTHGEKNPCGLTHSMIHSKSVRTGWGGLSLLRGVESRHFSSRAPASRLRTLSPRHHTSEHIKSILNPNRGAPAELFWRKTFLEGNIVFTPHVRQMISKVLRTAASVEARLEAREARQRSLDSAASGAAILWLEDDEYAAQHLAEAFALDRFSLFLVGSVDRAKQLLLSGETIDLVITDVMMPTESTTPEDVFGSRGGHYTGLVFAQWVKMQFPNLPVVAFSQSESTDVAQWFNSNAEGYISKAEGRRALRDHVRLLLGRVTARDLLKVFIVHGHDDKTK